MCKIKLAFIVLVIACLCLSYGCEGSNQSDTDTDTKTTTAAMTDDSGEYIKVNDASISRNDLEQFAKAKRVSQAESNFSDKDIIDEMIATELYTSRSGKTRNC